MPPATQSGSPPVAATGAGAPRPPGDDAFFRRQVWLTLFRLVLVTVLLGGTGVWEGENLVITVETEFPGPDQKMKKIKMREMYSDFKPGGFTFAIDSSIEGGPMKRMMTIHYTKAAPKASAEKMP